MINDDFIIHTIRAEVVSDAKSVKKDGQIHYIYGENVFALYIHNYLFKGNIHILADRKKDPLLQPMSWVYKKVTGRHNMCRHIGDRRFIISDISAVDSKHEALFYKQMFHDILCGILCRALSSNLHSV